MKYFSYLFVSKWLMISAKKHILSRRFMVLYVCILQPEHNCDESEGECAQGDKRHLHRKNGSERVEMQKFNEFEYEYAKMYKTNFWVKSQNFWIF